MSSPISRMPERSPLSARRAGPASSDRRHQPACRREEQRVHRADEMRVHDTLGQPGRARRLAGCRAGSTDFWLIRHLASESTKDFGKVTRRRRRGLTAYGRGPPQNHGASRLALARANCPPSYTTSSDTAEGDAIRWQGDRSGGAGLDPQRGCNSDIGAWPSAHVAHHWEG